MITDIILGEKVEVKPYGKTLWIEQGEATVRIFFHTFSQMEAISDALGTMAQSLRDEKKENE